MNATVQLKTEEDFKKMIEFLAEEYIGYKGAIGEVLSYCFESNFKEEYSFMDVNNIIDYGYDEADGEEYTNWLDFKDLSKESLDYFLGDYYINFSDDFDRIGNVSTRLFVKVEPKLTGQEFVTKFRKLSNLKRPIEQAIANLHYAIDKKDLALMDKAKVSDEEMKLYDKYTEELEEMGF